jgi:thymidylate kinase
MKDPISIVISGAETIQHREIRSLNSPPAPGQRMLVTISGMVGSGKSTAAARAMELLQGEGLDVESWRFQSLPIFSRGTSARSASQSSRESSPAHERWAGYTRRRLTARLAAGQLVRALIFRIYRRTRPHGRHQVCSRYFYDSFVHYTLSTPTERFYARLIRRCIPAPDLALLMVASPETIRARRPRYSSAYVTQVWEAYQTLPQLFPGLIAISTNAGDDGARAIEREILKWLHSSRVQR